MGKRNKYENYLNAKYHIFKTSMANISKLTDLEFISYNIFILISWFLKATKGYAIIIIYFYWYQIISISGKNSKNNNHVVKYIQKSYSKKKHAKKV